MEVVPLCSRKGQLVSIDALIGISVFAILFVFMTGFWYLGLKNVSDSVEKNRLETTALSVTEMLVKTPGIPPDWENNFTSIERPGFAVSEYDQNVLSGKKIENFTSLPYEMEKDLMGLNGTMDFYLTVEDNEGNILYSSGGMEDENYTVVSITRYAAIEGRRGLDPVKVRLMLYENH